MLLLMYCLLKLVGISDVVFHFAKEIILGAVVSILQDIVHDAVVVCIILCDLMMGPMVCMYGKTASSGVESMNRVNKTFVNGKLLIILMWPWFSSIRRVLILSAPWWMHGRGRSTVRKSPSLHKA
jgi:hypothetical protein